MGQQSFLKQVKTKEIFKKNLNITERVQDTLQRDTVSGALACASYEDDEQDDWQDLNCFREKLY